MRRDELFSQYGRVLDEYRFQVHLNWERSRHLLTLNLGLLTAAAALLGLQQEDAVLALPPVAGVVVSMLGIVMHRTQHGYYRRVRDLKTRLEDELDLGEFAVRTTAGMRDAGAQRRRLTRVADVHYIVFGLLGLLHLGLAGASVP